MHRTRRLILGLVALALLLAACGAASPEAACQSQVRAYAGNMQPILDEWDDAVTLAGSTSRISLAPQIASLQAIRRRVDTVSVPDCAQVAHRRLTDSMDKTIRAFLNFMAQSPESEVQDGLAAAALDLQRYTEEILRLGGVSAPPTQVAVTAPTRGIQAVQPTARPTVRPTTGPKEPIITVPGVVQMYAGPGTNYPVVGRVAGPVEVRLEVVRVENGVNWYRTRFRDVDGWIQVIGIDPEVLKILPVDTQPLPTP